MIEEKRENRGEQPEEQVNIQEILFRYLIHWPWFVVSVIICIVCAWGYLRLATPVYNISATVLIKDDKKGGGTVKFPTRKLIFILISHKQSQIVDHFTGKRL